MHLTSRQLNTTSSSISTIFSREKNSTTNKRQKILPKNSSNPEAWIFFLMVVFRLLFFEKKSELQKALEWLCSLQGPQSNKKHS